MRKSEIVLFFGLAGGLLNAPADAQNNRQVDVVVRSADGAPVGDSTLLRYDNRINAVVRTSDLDPGAAVTVWWRIYNRPRRCANPDACEVSDLDNPDVEGSQLHATGFVVGNADGSATVVATLYRTAKRAYRGGSFADSLTEGFLKGPGLRRPLEAEVELLFASHGGLANRDEVGEQAALDQLLSPGSTPVDCAEPGASEPWRTFRCGVIQRVDHAPPD